MSYQMTVHAKPNYLHFVVTGKNSPENVTAYVNQLLKECKDRKCFRILVEERLEGPRLKIADVFHVVMDASLKGRDVMQDIAYVDVNAEGDLMKFARDIAAGRGLHFNLFSTVKEAEEWINKGN